MDIFRLDIAIPSQCGNLEGRLLYPDTEYEGAGVIICPPHPLLAGNMENNVITAIAETLAPFLPVLLFNYRGVGKSCSPCPELPLYEYWLKLDADDDYGEVVDDVARILEWSAGYFHSHHIIGYSFGSFIALRAVNEKTISYAAIAPPLQEHDFSALSHLTFPRLFLLAEHDNLLRAAGSDLLKQTEIIRNTDHFFRQKEAEVAKVVKNFLLDQR